MRVLILANGDPPSPLLAQRLAAKHDLLIATDGAANHAPTLGIVPHIISGDFDSIEAETARQAFPEAQFLPTPDQEFADLEKAIHLAQERGATTITIVGAFGGRIDHTLGGIALLLRYQREIAVTLIDDRAQMWLLAAEAASETFTFPAMPGDTISLFALDAGVYVTAQGVKWPLRDELLAIGTRGVSNVAEAETVRLAARGGRLVVCHLRA